MQSVLPSVLPWTDTAVSAVELFSSFEVTFGLFAAPLMNALLSWSVSFNGWLYVDRPVVVPYPFNFVMMGFQIFSLIPTWICSSPQLLLLFGKLCGFLIVLCIFQSMHI